MTEEDLARLEELDKLIAWNNPTDKGRPLTPAEKEEHRQLAMQMFKEEERANNNGKKGI